MRGTLVVAADPITLTTSDVARLSVLVNANDVAVCGARPRWFLAVVLVPPATARRVDQRSSPGSSRASASWAWPSVGGHTEVTAAVNQPGRRRHRCSGSSRGRDRDTGGFSRLAIRCPGSASADRGCCRACPRGVERPAGLDAGTWPRRGGARTPGHLRRGAAFLPNGSAQGRCTIRPRGASRGPLRDGRGGRVGIRVETDAVLLVRAWGRGVHGPWSVTRGRRSRRGRCSPRFRKRPSRTPCRRSKRRGMRLRTGFGGARSRHGRLRRHADVSAGARRGCPHPLVLMRRPTGW